MLVGREIRGVHKGVAQLISLIGAVFQLILRAEVTCRIR